MGFKRGRFCTIAKYDDTVSVQIIKIPFNADGRNLPVKAIRRRMDAASAEAAQPMMLTSGFGVRDSLTGQVYRTRNARSAASCTPDAFRLCSAHIPDADEVAACLREWNAELATRAGNLSRREQSRPIRATASTLGNV